jgi:MFS transporter, DHA1 family, multidrug resistance protein
VAHARVARVGQRELIAVLAMSMALTALGIDLMLPAFAEIRADLGLAPASPAVAGVVTAYFLGLAFGQLVAGPVADRFGRRTTLYLGYALYGVGALVSAVAPTLGAVLVARFVWGVGAAGPRVAAVAMVRDRFEGAAMSRVMSSIMAVFVLVPVLAPAVGAGVLAVSSWRWLFALCALAAGGLALWARRIPETLRDEHRIERLQFRPVLRAARLVLTTRQTVTYMLAMTAFYGAFFSYLGSSENIVGETYGRPGAFPVVFGVVAATMGVAMVVNGRIVERLGLLRLAHGALVAYVVVATVYLAVALAAEGRPPLGFYIAGTAALLAAHALLIPNLNTIAMGPMAAVAGTAASVIGAVQVAVGALIGALIDRAFDGTIRPLATGFLLCGVFGLGLVLASERGRLFGPADPLAVPGGPAPSPVAGRPG